MLHIEKRTREGAYELGFGKAFGEISHEVEQDLNVVVMVLHAAAWVVGGASLALVLYLVFAP